MQMNRWVCVRDTQSKRELQYFMCVCIEIRASDKIDWFCVPYTFISLFLCHRKSNKFSSIYDQFEIAKNDNNNSSSNEISENKSAVNQIGNSSHTNT